MFRRGGAATLGEYARGYALLHDVRPETVGQYRITADLFERWAGGPVSLQELDERSVSAWLRDYSAASAPSTVRSKRNQILALWRAAADEGFCEPPTLRVRGVRVPRLPVEAWTYDEVVRLLQAAGEVKRRHRCGLPRRVWWPLAIRVAWDTGLRWGDQIALPVGAVAADGAVWWSQHKTGRVVVCQLSPSTLALLRESLEAVPRELVMPWPASHETFTDQVKRLVAAAGVRPGTWKWLRRSSGSYVELEQQGAGAEHLGHAPGSRVFRDHYASPRILLRTIPSPPELPAAGFG
jgi:integrase